MTLTDQQRNLITLIDDALLTADHVEKFYNMPREKVNHLSFYVAMQYWSRGFMVAVNAFLALGDLPALPLL